MSPTEYSKRLQPLLNLSTVQNLVEVIVLKDRQNLKEEKIDEWKRGQRPNETDIGHYRSKAYEEFKYRLNPLAYGTVDLILTGQTANSLFVHKGVSNGSFTFGMKDTHNLIPKYGKDILGLNQNTFLTRQKEVYLKQFILEIKSKYKIS